VTEIPLGDSAHAHTLDFHTAERRVEHIRDYHRVLCGARGLHVTTSCFASWSRSGRANGAGKVVPTISTSSIASRSEKPHRIFFFDDNVELQGLKESPGICDLVDVETGEFVDFSVGRNGFERGRAGRHSVVIHSKEYNSVIVKVSVLDAIESKDYFLDIVREYSEPGEKIIIMMDVNSTIMCLDTVQTKDLSASLASVMFDLLDFCPASSFELSWADGPKVNISKRTQLKKLVKQATIADSAAYKSFFCNEANSRDFLKELFAHGEIRWPGVDESLDMETYERMFEEYLAVVEGGVSADGITKSWFALFEAMKTEHMMMLNSFGVDTRKVVRATQPDESNVLQVVVSFELWEARDVDKFKSQFAASDTLSLVPKCSRT